MSDPGECSEGYQQVAIERCDWAEAEFLHGLKLELKRDLVDVSDEAEELPEKYGMEGNTYEYLKGVEDKAYKL